MEKITSIETIIANSKIGILRKEKTLQTSEKKEEETKNIIYIDTITANTKREISSKEETSKTPENKEETFKFVA